MSLAARSLSLYRRILRTARNWQGPPEERTYIETTAKQGFRENRCIEPAEAEAKLSEAEQRLELGVHYGIPYPRLHHTPKMFKRRTYLQPPQLPTRGAPKRDG